MILHKMNGEAFIFDWTEIHDVRKSEHGVCAEVLIRDGWITVREAVNQVRQIIKQEREGFQLELNL